MTSELQYPFTQQQIAEQGQGNLGVFILGGIAYAKAQGQEGRDFARFLGQKVIPGWVGITSPAQAAVAVALNCASAGMTVLSAGGDDARGEAVTSDWPEAEFLTMFGLSQADADQVWECFSPVAQSLGYSYHFQRDGGQLHFIFTK